VKVLLEVLGSCSGITVGSKNGCVIGKGCYSCGRGGGEVSGVNEIEERSEDTVLWDAGVNWGYGMLDGTKADKEMPFEQKGL
jgi:hypothetical protein